MPWTVARHSGVPHLIDISRILLILKHFPAESVPVCISLEYPGSEAGREYLDLDIELQVNTKHAVARNFLQHTHCTKYIL